MFTFSQNVKFYNRLGVTRAKTTGKNRRKEIRVGGWVGGWTGQTLHLPEKVNKGQLKSYSFSEFLFILYHSNVCCADKAKR